MKQDFVLRGAVAFSVVALIVACERTAPPSDAGRTQAQATASVPSTTQTLPPRLHFGRPATRAELAAWNIDVNPKGTGLPDGRGTHAQGAVVFRARCASCHGAAGEGTPPPIAGPKLIGAEPRDSFPFASDWKLAKTIGNYWPYATTLYDYIHRAMPLDAPGSLKPDEIYALCAYLLAENGVIARDAVMDRRSLPAVKMPAHDRFVRDDRLTTSEFR